MPDHPRNGINEIAVVVAFRTEAVSPQWGTAARARRPRGLSISVICREAALAARLLWVSAMTRARVEP
jgi:hypothetical protein